MGGRRSANQTVSIVRGGRLLRLPRIEVLLEAVHFKTCMRVAFLSRTVKLASITKIISDYRFEPDERTG